MTSNRSTIRSFIVGTILVLSILAAAAQTPTMTASTRPEDPWFVARVQFLDNAAASTKE
jgi:hypothetical protein